MVNLLSDHRILILNNCDRVQFHCSIKTKYMEQRLHVQTVDIKYNSV
jgi:hypothetical protein